MIPCLHLGASWLVKKGGSGIGSVAFISLFLLFTEMASLGRE